MKTKVEYNYAQVALNTLEIDDISSVCIRARNELNYEWYLLITTELGVTKIKEFGPCLVDASSPINGFSYKYNELDYNEGKICGRIEKFIQDPKRVITSIDEIDINEFEQVLFNQMK